LTLSRGQTHIQTDRRKNDATKRFTVAIVVGVRNNIMHTPQFL